MRTLQDSDDTAGFTEGADFYAAYVPPGHDNFGATVARFPGKRVLSIATRFPTDADILDYESSTTGTGPQNARQAVAWVVRQRARGAIPYVYANTSTWPELVAAFAAAAVPLPEWWAAHWTNVPHLEPGSRMTQYGGDPGVDYSVCADYLPGIDPEPSQPKEADMFIALATNPQGQLEEWLVLGVGRIALTAEVGSPNPIPASIPSWTFQNYGTLAAIPLAASPGSGIGPGRALELTPSGSIVLTPTEQP